MQRSPKKYYRHRGNQHWVFTAKIQDKNAKPIYLDLVEMDKTPIRRHVKIKSDATPFNPVYEKYFRVRQIRRKEKRLFFGDNSQWNPWWELQAQMMK